METSRYCFDVTPIGAVRQNRSDAWRKRPAVIRYRSYRDELKSEAQKYGFKVPTGFFHITFNVPMPKSWSNRRRLLMVGTPHRQKPDIDNLQKAFLDALCVDDSFVFDLRASKVWSEIGSIEVDIPMEEA
jgi:Holliday junction resolvase RusA-like endonuclease